MSISITAIPMNRANMNRIGFGGQYEEPEPIPQKPLTEREQFIADQAVKKALSTTAGAVLDMSSTRPKNFNEYSKNLYGALEAKYLEAK